MKQDFDNYTSDDLLVWKTLFERQEHNLQDKACEEYLKALDVIREVLNPNEMPNFEKINRWFQSNTGWRIECVPELIPVDEFFELLANRKFCSSQWLRKMSQLDYLEEPDMFHDIVGHIPLLTNQAYSEFMVAFGKLGVQFSGYPEMQKQLQRLYWYTIEFGLIEQDFPKIYGAGILSSFGESNFSLAGETLRYNFDLEKVLQTDFENDHIQTHYFVIPSFEELYNTIETITLKWTSYEMAEVRK